MVDTPIDFNKLVTINLKYGSGAKPLKILAFAQLSAKALFFSNSPKTSLELSAITAKLIGVNKVSEDFITAGLTYLAELGKAHKNNSTWFLTHEARKEINSEIKFAREQLDALLTRHFSKEIERPRLQKWFDEAAASFFGYYGNEWVHSTCRGINQQPLKPKTADELLSPSLSKYKFREERQALIDGFINFLSSSNTADQNYLMSLGLAMFSARLVAADVGADPLALEELKNSTFILDTNVLIVLSLESSRRAKSLKALGAALKKIGANLIYLHTTKEEYERALSGKRGEILRLVDTFPKEIIKETRDDFISTAIMRGCETKEDFERFFFTLNTIPSALQTGPNIKIEDYDDLQKATSAAEKDTKLKQQIQDHYIKYRAWWKKPSKSESALNHDAALIHTANLYRNQFKAKCWILSLDKTFQLCAATIAGPNSMPIVISVDALISILAVNSAGPELESNNFAPLLANIILNQCLPPSDTYTTEDLHWLVGINERAADLPIDEVKILIKQITKARMEGKSIDNTRLQLKVNRLFQEKKVNFNQQLEEAKTRVRDAEKETQLEKIASEKKENLLISSRIKLIKDRALKRLLLQLLWRTIVVLTITVIIFLIYQNLFNKANKNDIINYFFSGVSLIIAVLGLIPHPISQYNESIKNSTARARDEIRKELT